MEDIFAAIILGIVEGLTEFLPVSSTGHLILVSPLLGLHDESIKTFEVFIQLGAIMAVVLLYQERFRLLLSSEGSLVDRGLSGRAGIAKLIVASIPAMIAGVLLHSYIKSKLFYPMPVAVALIVGGIVLLFVERMTPKSRITTLDELSYAQAFGVGVFQIFSLWPGISRAGSTIVGGLVLGLPRVVAAEFSFLISVPIMFAAVTFDLWKSASILSLKDIPVFGVGFLVSLITAIVAIRFFLDLLRRFTLVPFGVYRIVLGCLVMFL